MVSPWEVRELVGLRYGDPPIDEARYDRERTLSKDAALLARLMVSGLLPRLGPNGGGPRSDEATVRRPRVVSAPVDPLDTAEAIERIVSWLEQGSGGTVFFVHPHALNLAARKVRLRSDLEAAKLVLPDGIGVRIACAILGVSLPANVNGTDLVPELLVELAARRIPIALAGGGPGVAERAAAAWSERTPLDVRATVDGFQTEDRYRELAERMEEQAPCVVFLAFGTPIQERLAIKHFAERQGVVVLTVGGLFDFAAGDKPRAPMAWRELGLEWVWRLRHEPRRLAKRYLLGNPEFLARASWQRIRG